MDKTLLLWIQSYAHPWLDGFFWWVSDQLTFTLPLLLFVGALAYIHYKSDGLKAWLLLLVMIGITDTLGNGLKSLAAQPRPCHDLYEALHFSAMPFSNNTAKPPCSASLKGMPSNHALNFFAAAMASVWVVRRRRWSIFIFGVAAVVAVSRVYLGKHYPSQVLVGAVTGVAMGGLYAWLCLRYFTFLRQVKKHS